MASLLQRASRGLLPGFGRSALVGFGGRMNLSVRQLHNWPVSIKQQMVGVRTKLKTHSGAKKRFSVTGTGLVKFRRANRYHKMYAKSKNAKNRLFRTAYLQTTQARRVLNLLPYQMGRAKLLQRRAHAKRLNRMELEAKAVRAALAEQHPPEYFTRESRGQALALQPLVLEYPERLKSHIARTDSFEDPHAMAYAGEQTINLPIRTDPISIEKMVRAAAAQQIAIFNATRPKGQRRHRWRPLQTKGVSFPPTTTPALELARQVAQRKAFQDAVAMRETRTRQTVLKQHLAAKLRAQMIREHA